MERTFHEDFSRQETPAGASNRSVGLTMAVFFAVLAFLPTLRARPIRWWAVWPAGIFLVVSLGIPVVLQPLNRLWMGIGLQLSRITNPIITALMFYVVFTPTALIIRLLGKDPLRLKFDQSAETYWIERKSSSPAPDAMRHQF